MSNNINEINKSNHISTASLVGWCLFDFSNSIPVVIGGIYFSKWFISDINGGTIAFNILFFLSALIIMLTGKLIGRHIDNIGHFLWTIVSSVICFLSMLFLYFGSQYLSGQPLIYLSFILFLLFLFGYQIGRICLNVYLKTIIPPSLQPRMSGFGAASNWAGSIIGILITIPIINSYPVIQARELTFLASGLVFGILISLSILLMFLSKKRVYPTKHDQVTVPVKQSWKTIFTTTGLLMLGYFLLFDTMSTVEKNLPPFLQTVVKMTDNDQSMAFLLILVFAMIGGLLASKAITYANSKYWLRLCSFTLGISVILVISQNGFLIWSAFPLAGISYGILESAIRVNYMNRIELKQSGEKFGILAAVERTSGIVGPLLWIIPFMFYENPKKAYVGSMLLMAALAFFAMTIFLFLNNKKDNQLITKQNIN